MFRRLQAGLPKDPVYPADLAGLGYFINDKDEIRSIENPKAYFKFFLTRSERYNNLQRGAMNQAVRNIIFDRLVDLGLQSVRLPLGAGETEPHLPIFISSNLETKKRVIILFYENNQDLGVFAHRIVGGKGGINAGSVVDMVKYIQSLKTSATTDDAPGIILANMGEMRWWRHGKKAVTLASWHALPQRSAVDAPYKFDPVKNTIPRNRSTEEHVEYIFDHVVKCLVAPRAKLDVIAVSEGAVRVSEFLDDETNWKKWSQRIEAYAAVATYFHADEITNKAFGHWFRDRGRAYIISPEPSGTFLAGPEGRRRINAYGCPAFSLGEPYYTEAMLPRGYKTVIDWFQEVAADPDYANPELHRFDVMMMIARLRWKPRSQVLTWSELRRMSDMVAGFAMARSLDMIIEARWF